MRPTKRKKRRDSREAELIPSEANATQSQEEKEKEQAEMQSGESTPKKPFRIMQ
jgi:hypothetical protein